MFPFSTVLILIAVFGSFSNAQQTVCTFQIVLNRYACRLVAQNIASELDMEQVVGIHLPNYNDSRVQRLDHTNSVVQVFPTLIMNQFPNLISVHLSDVEMRSIERPIVNCRTLFTIDLNNNHLVSIPEGIFRNCQELSTLTMRRNLISNIHDNAFVGLSRAFILTLTENKIKIINRNMMNPLSRLGILDLDGNEIEQLDANTLEVLPNLQTLSLRNNKISTWNVNILQRNPRIERLQLSGNQIQTLDVNTFSNLPNLIELSIGSLLEVIPAFENLLRLENLVLDGNQLTHVSASSFVNMPNLNRAFLGRNRIESFDFSMTSTRILTNFRYLEMTNNSIAEIAEGSLTMLGNLSYFGLSRNQLAKLSFSAFDPVLPLQTLDVRDNRISRVDREIFENAVTMNFFATGNVCVNTNFVIDSTSDLSRLNRCFNSARSLKINIFAVVAVIFIIVKV